MYQNLLRTVYHVKIKDRVTLFYKEFVVRIGMWFSNSLGPKDSKKSKFDHLEGRLVVLAWAWSLWSELH